MVELLLKKTCVFDQDIMWINTQFVVCCNEGIIAKVLKLENQQIFIKILQILYLL